MNKIADEIQQYLAFYRALIDLLNHFEDGRAKLLVKSMKAGLSRIESEDLSDAKKQRQVLAGLKQGYRELPQLISEGLPWEAADRVRDLIALGMQSRP